MSIDNYFFPVEEREVSLHPAPAGDNQQKIKGFKAIVRPGPANDRVISVVKNSYKLVRNIELVDPFLEQVHRLGVNWYIDSSHSFCTINKMRLQVTFPDLYLRDSESNIPLSLYLHNSYDMSEGIRLFWGAIRSICSNGMVFGDVLGKFYARHTRGFDFEKISVQFTKATEKIGRLQGRIYQLESQSSTLQFLEELQESIGKRLLAKCVDMDSAASKSKWSLMNDITHHISHEIDPQRRADLQRKVSKAFQL